MCIVGMYESSSPYQLTCPSCALAKSVKPSTLELPPYTMPGRIIFAVKPGEIEERICNSNGARQAVNETGFVTGVLSEITLVPVSPWSQLPASERKPVNIGARNTSSAMASDPYPSNRYSSKAVPKALLS